MSVKHAKLSCSSAHRWMRCAASPSFIEALSLPSTSSSFANEGSAAHELHENILLNTIPSFTNPPKSLSIDDPITIDNETSLASEDMFRCVKISTDYVKNRCDTCAFDDQEAQIEVEKWVSLSKYHIKGLDGGTADVILRFIDMSTNLINEIEIVDYKHGRGAVDPADNPQLMMYAIGAIDAKLHSLSAPDISAKLRVKLTIIQPRARGESIKTHELSYKELEQWKNKHLLPCAKATTIENPVFSPSETACKWCPALAHCDAAAKKVEKLAQIDFSKSPPKCKKPVNKLSISQKKAIFQHQCFIKAFISAICSDIQNDLINGNSTYNDVAKLVRKKTNAKFKENAFNEFLSPLFDILDESDIYKTIPKNITEIKKSLLNEISVDKCENVMHNITYKPDGELEAVLLNDKRETVKLKKEKKL